LAYTEPAPPRTRPFAPQARGQVRTHLSYLRTAAHVEPHPSPHSTLQELRVEVVSFGPRTPPAVTGLRCLAAPTEAEVDTALMMLLEYKRRAKQVRRRGRRRI